MIPADFILSLSLGFPGIHGRQLLRYRFEDDDMPVVYSCVGPADAWTLIGRVNFDEFESAFANAIPPDEARQFEFNLPCL